MRHLSFLKMRQLSFLLGEMPPLPIKVTNLKRTKIWHDTYKHNLTILEKAYEYEIKLPRCKESHLLERYIKFYKEIVFLPS